MTTTTNWAKNIEITPTRTHSPSSPEEVCDLIRRAGRENRRVRAIGGKWSFTDVGVTDDVLVETRELRGVLAMSRGRTRWEHTIPNSGPSAGLRSNVLFAALTDEQTASNRAFVHVLAGTNLRELYLALDCSSGYRSGERGDWTPGRPPWMMITKVGLSGQTLGGALATGSHGGDCNLPPPGDAVWAIELACADGRLHWIERSSTQRLTDDARLRAVRGAGVPVHRDDDLFNAALVGLGTVGVVTSFVMEVRDQYGLSERAVRTTWADIKASIVSGAIFDTTQYSEAAPEKRWSALHPTAADRKVRGLGIAINLYQLDDDLTHGPTDRMCRLSTQMETAAYDGDHIWSADPHEGFKFLDLIHDFESGGIPGARSAINAFLELWSPENGTNGKYRRSYTVWDPQPVWRHGIFPSQNLFLGQEIAITTRGGAHVRCVDALMERFDRILRERWAAGVQAKFAGAIFLRFSRPSDALLGMQHSDANDPQERFCYIEVLVAKELDLLTAFLKGQAVAGHHNMENFTEEWIAAFEEIAREFGGRMHWGQLNRLNAGLVEDGYAPSLHRWRSSVGSRLGHGNTARFASDFSTRIGLHRSADMVTVCAAPPGGVDVVGLSTTGGLRCLEYGGSSVWSVVPNGAPSETLVGPITACRGPAGELNVFIVAASGSVVWAARTTVWTWAIVPRDMLSGIHVISSCALGGGALGLVGVDRSGALRVVRHDAGAWRRLEVPSSGSVLVDACAAATPTGASVFCRGRDRSMKRARISATGACEWHDLPAEVRRYAKEIAGPLTATVDAGGLATVFAVSATYEVLCFREGATWRCERVKASFPGRLWRYGMRPDFGERPTVDKTFQYLGRWPVEERFRGTIAACTDAGGRLSIWGTGESGNLCRMTRPGPAMPWRFADLGDGWTRDAGKTVTQLVVDVWTGNDNLETRSSADFVVRFRDGREEVYDLTRGEGWGGGWLASRLFTLPAPVSLGLIESIGIRFRAGGSAGQYDNWDLRALTVAFSGSAGAGLLFSQVGEPLWRFYKNSDQEWSAAVGA